MANLLPVVELLLAITTNGERGGHNELSWTDRTLRFLSLARLVS